MSKKLIFIFILFYQFVSFAQNKEQRIVFINYDSALHKLPEYVMGQDSLNLFQKLLEDEMRCKSNIFELFFKDVSRCNLGWDSLKRVTTEQKLQNLRQEVTDFEFLALKKFKQKQESILSSCYQKIKITVKRIALEKGYDFVFYLRKDDKSLFCYLTQTNDITELVILEIIK
jgi:Skp family chaperone for outer membrane proteins